MPLLSILSRASLGGAPIPPAGVPSISLSSASISLEVPESGEPSALLDSVTISNAGGGAMDTPTVGTITDADGIVSSTQITGSGPWTLLVELTRNALSPGNYSATIPVLCANAENSPQNVTANLTVTAVSAGDDYPWTEGTTDNGADLPTTKVDTAIDWASQTGTVHTVTSQSEFATALTNQASQDNPVIKVTTNIDLTSSLTLPNRTGSGYCYIVSDYEYQRVNGGGTAFAKAPGERATSSDVSTMRRLRATSANAPIFNAPTQASPGHHYRIIGFEMTGTTTQQAGLIRLGDSSTATQANFPHHIIVDRCYLYGNPGTTNMRRGVDMNGQYTAVIDSTLVKFYDSGASESQAILLRWSAGPYKIVNNDLSAAGEVILFGGDSSSICPTDAEIRYNYLHAEPSWEGVYAVKNLLEIKFASRVLVEANDLRYMWVSGQSGHAIHIKSTSQSGNGGGSQYKTSDVIVRFNRVRDYQEPFRVLGATEDSNQSTDNLVIRDNLFVEKRSGNGWYYIEAAVNAGPLNGLVVKNNVIDSSHTSAPGYCNTTGRTKGDALTFQSNVIRTASNGSGPIWADSTPNAANAVAAVWTSSTFTNNGVYGSWSTGTISGNTVSASGTWNGIFTDQAAGDYTIAGASAFKGCGVGGADPGPDSTIMDRIQYSIGGQRPGEV